ncbi:MAG: hypothetical protein ACI9WU_003606 [Myxococcota bacterium]|jgi:hypothetical protein
MHPDQEFALLVTTAVDKEATTFLANMFADLKDASLDEQRAGIAFYLQQLHNRVQAPETWAEARKMVSLAMRGAAYTTSLSFGEGDGPVFRPVLGGSLVQVLCLDLETSIQTVPEDSVAAWGVSVDEAWAAAAANLKTLAPRIEPAEPGTMARIMAGQIDAASYLLAPGWLAACKGDHDVLAWSSGREWIVVLTHDGDPDLRMLATMPHEQWSESQHMVSPCLYTLDAHGAVVPVTVPADHPAFAELELSRKSLTLAEYDNQKRVLEHHYEVEDIDTFVPSFKLHDADDGLQSMGVWTHDVHTLLPRTDMALPLDSDERSTVVPFEALLQLMPGVRERTDLYPTRYEVDGFPTPAEMKSLSKLAVPTS